MGTESHEELAQYFFSQQARIDKCTEQMSGSIMLSNATAVLTSAIVVIADQHAACDMARIADQILLILHCSLQEDKLSTML